MGSNPQLDGHEANILPEGHGTAGADSFLLVGAQPREAKPNTRFDPHQQEATGRRPQVPGVLPDPESLLGKIANPASVDEEAQSPARLENERQYSKIRTLNNQISQNYQVG